MREPSSATESGSRQRMLVLLLKALGTPVAQERTWRWATSVALCLQEQAKKCYITV